MRCAGAFYRGARAPVCIAEWHLRLRYADLPGGLVAAMFTGLPYHGGALRDRADRPAYLRENRIETRQQLTMLWDALQGEMDAHTEQRRQLYLARRRGVEGLDAEIAAHTERLRRLRKEWRQCCAIEADARRIEQQFKQQREQEILDQGGPEHGCRQRSR